MRKCYFVGVVVLAAMQGLWGVSQAQGELLIHYKMDANNGGLVDDYSSYGSDGVLNGTDYSIQSGIIGNSVHVGAQSYVQADDVNVAQLNKNFSNMSAAMWVNPSRPIGSAEVQYLMGKYAKSSHGWFFMVNKLPTPAGYRVQVYSSAYDSSATNYTSDPYFYPAPYEWTHLAFTFNSGQGTLYVNGQAYAHTTSSSPDSVVTGINSADFQVGHRGDDSYADISTGLFNGFEGEMDDVAVWDVTIDAQRMALIHGLGRFVEVDLGSSEIDNVLNAFLAGPGQSATAGGYEWSYASGLYGELGAINNGAIGNAGIFVSNGSAYIVLDGMGNGMKIGQVPEPSTMALLATGLIGLLAYAWRKRK